MFDYSATAHLLRPLLPLFLLVAGGFVLYLLKIRYWPEHFGSGGGGDNGSTWATPRQVKAHTTSGPQPGRLFTLTPSKGRVVSLDDDHSLLIFGASTSGKTLRALIPNVAKWVGPCMAVSTKNDLMKLTSGLRSDCVVFSPGSPFPGLRNIGWSPLGAIARKIQANDMKGAWETALLQAKAATSTTNMNNVKGGDFWTTSASKSYAPLLLAAAIDAPNTTMKSVTEWVSIGDVEEPKAILAQAYDAPPQALSAIESLDGLPPDMRGAVIGTLSTILLPYSFSGVLDASTSPDQFDPEWLLDPEGHMRTLYIASNAAIQEYIAPVFNGIIQEVITARYAEADAALLLTKGTRERAIPSHRRLLIALDECANIAPMPNLPKLVSEGASHGINTAAVFQDLAQMKEAHGTSATTIVNNCQARLITRGVADPETLNLFGSLLGQTTRRRTSTTTGSGSNSTTTALTDLPLADAAGLRSLAAGTAVLIYAGTPPIQGKLLPHGAFTPAAEDGNDQASRRGLLAYVKGLRSNHAATDRHDEPAQPANR